MSVCRNMTEPNKIHFFEPWIGNNYDQGFEGVKILVVGVCHICSYECPYRSRCSTPEGIREMDYLCPDYSRQSDQEWFNFHNFNNIEIGSFVECDASYPAYKSFTYYMLRCVGNLPTEKRRQLWDYVAFTNFLQILHHDGNNLPASEDLFDSDYIAFKEVVNQLEPEAIFAWNNEIRDCLKRHRADFIYVGKADIQFGISIYIFMPAQTRLKGKKLAKLRYRYNIVSETHLFGWYKKLVVKHLGKSLSQGENSIQIKKLAESLKDLVEMRMLGATETGLYFSDSFNGQWSSLLKGVFLAAVKEEFPNAGQGFNKGMEEIFDESLATNKRDISLLNETQKLMAEKIRDKFPSYFRKNNF